MVTVQDWLAARVEPQVVVLRKGHSLVMRRTVTRVGPGLVRVRVLEEVWPEVTWLKLSRLPGKMPPVMSSEDVPLP
jgi:hypothetical protein